MLNQPVLSRAWDDTKASFHKIFFFWGVEVVATGLFAYIGTIITPEHAGRFASAAYPAIGAFFGVIVGFSIIFAINLFLAPYRQRNEVRNLLLNFKSEKAIGQQRAQIKENIGVLIIEGTEVLKGFKSVRTFGDAWPTEEFNAWRGKVSELLMQPGLVEEYSLWFRSVGIDIQGSRLSDFIEACEAGLQRLEDILTKLRD